eukprot:TRINITY_DN3274_c0_g1_i1.p4 TRINITY_DN3274_c0_g1~~TRINITY_DN3274_c0_g1_i1.p4  ORF type:complete len:237 (-),score=25.21 TRINITY_DN3274_c0_g1_i1:1848-2471(-)
MSTQKHVESHIKFKEFRPLKFGVKYFPPAIAVLYCTKSNPMKKYMHEIPVDNSLLSKSSFEVYLSILKNEPLYLNPKVVSRKQVVRLIELLMQKKFDDKSSDPIEEMKKTSSRPTPVKPLSGLQPLKMPLETEGLREQQSVYEKMFEGGSRDDDEINQQQEADDFMGNFQVVFVEELDREVLMDRQGNLFDFDGKLIGQAASDDEDC